MPMVIYKVTRQGGMGLGFEGTDGTGFVDPRGLANPQLAKILGKRLVGYVRCEVGAGMAEVVGEASAEEVAAFEGTDSTAGEDLSGDGAFRFPGA